MSGIHVPGFLRKWGGGDVITTIVLNDKYRINLVFDDKSITLMKHFNCISGDQVSMLLFVLYMYIYVCAWIHTSPDELTRERTCYDFRYQSQLGLS